MEFKPSSGARKIIASNEYTETAHTLMLDTGSRIANLHRWLFLLTGAKDLEKAPWARKTASARRTPGTPPSPGTFPRTMTCTYENTNRIKIEFKIKDGRYYITLKKTTRRYKKNVKKRGKQLSREYEWNTPEWCRFVAKITINIYARNNHDYYSK